ncbi:MAG: tRNA adenosine(34) deaminase TadA [Clostridia bacterium]|nr:tRNA adenosine(34) deaminase TadA [Clostridia bacterium]
MTNTQDYEFYMDKALELAKKARAKDEVPVGAVIVRDGKIIASAFNKRQNRRVATYHAEILAIEKACKKVKDFRLNGCTIFVTLEPCVMCMGAIINARIETLVFGAGINKDNTLSSKEIAERAGLNHNLKIVSGIRAKKCSMLVSEYFSQKRN